MGRLKQHLRDRHHGSWDRFSVYLTVRDEHMRELESLLLRIVSPQGNKKRGQFIESENVYPQLNELIKEYDADRRAELLGGWVALRRQKAKGRKARGKGALKGLVQYRMTLRAERDGRQYKASLRRDGTIRYHKKLFDSPNAAARAAVGKPVGGWGFWKYKNRKGEWVALRHLKGR